MPPEPNNGRDPPPLREVLVELLERIAADPGAGKSGKWARTMLAAARDDQADTGPAPPPPPEAGKRAGRRRA